MGQRRTRKGGVVKLYFYNLLIGVDQFANVLLGGAPDQTISYRAHKHREHWAGAMAVRFIDWLFSWYEDGHCQKSYEAGDRHTEEVWG